VSTVLMPFLNAKCLEDNVHDFGLQNHGRIQKDTGAQFLDEWKQRCNVMPSAATCVLDSLSVGL
jgi:hypothetical protein